MMELISASCNFNKAREIGERFIDQPEVREKLFRELCFYHPRCEDQRSILDLLRELLHPPPSPP